MTYSSVNHHWQPFLGSSPQLQSRSNDDIELLAPIRELELNGPDRSDDRGLARRAAYLLLLYPEDAGITRPSANSQAYNSSTQTVSPMAYGQSVPRLTNLPTYQAIDVQPPYPPTSHLNRLAYSPANSLDEESNSIHNTEQFNLSYPLPTAVQFSPMTRSLNDQTLRSSTDFSGYPLYTQTSPESSVSGAYAHPPGRRTVHPSAYQCAVLTPSTAYISRPQNVPASGNSNSLADKDFYGNPHRPNVGASSRAAYLPLTAMSGTSSTSYHQAMLTPGSTASSSGGTYARAYPPSTEAPDRSANRSPLPMMGTPNSIQHGMTRTPSSTCPTAALNQRWNSPALPSIDFNFNFHTGSELATNTRAEAPSEHLGNFNMDNYVPNPISPWTQLHSHSERNPSLQLGNTTIDPIGLDDPSYTTTGTQAFDGNQHGSD